MSEHTATPWPPARHATQCGVEWWKIEGIADFNTQEDAEFIVLACNSHEALLEACKRFLAAHAAGMPETKVCLCGPCEEARAAIAQATGEK